MSDYTEVASVTFTTPLISEGSWGERDLGTHESTMTFYKLPQAGRGFIEWDIPALDDSECIGLTWDNFNEMEDYDGVFSLPEQAIKLLRDNGIKVGPDFE